MVKRKLTAKEIHKSDFKRRKRRVGKRAPMKLAATRTTFTVKKLLIDAQSVLDDKRNAEVNDRRLTLEELLSRTFHHNVDTRKSSFLGLKQLLTMYPHLLVHHLGLIIQKVMLTTTDEDEQVRHTGFLLISFIFETCHSEMMIPFTNLIQHCISSSMTHLRKSIRQNSISFFKLCLNHFPSLLWNPIDVIKILPNLRGLLMDRVQSKRKMIMGQTLKEKKGDAASLEGIVGCIATYMEHCPIVENKKESTNIIPSENADMPHLSRAIQQYGASLNDIIKPQSKAKKADSIANERAILKYNSIVGTDEESTKLINPFIATLTPILIECWVENLPGLDNDNSIGKSSAFSDKDSFRASCLHTISHCICVFFQIQLAQNNNFHILYGKDLSKHVFVNFPLVAPERFTQEFRQFITATNDNLCSLLMYFLPRTPPPLKCHKNYRVKPTIITTKHFCSACKEDIIPGNFIFKCQLCADEIGRCMQCYNQYETKKAFKDGSEEYGPAMLEYLRDRLNLKSLRKVRRRQRKKQQKKDKENTPADNIDSIITGVLPIFSKLLNRVWFSEQLLIVKCFSQFFLALPDSPTKEKKECIAFLIELLKLKSATKWMSASEIGIIECIHSLPSCLSTFRNEDPYCSKMIIRLLLDFGRHQKDRTIRWVAYSSFDFDTLQPHLISLFTRKVESNAKKVPFAQLEVPLQKKITELLYYFKFLSAAMLQAIMCCCKDESISQSIRYYMVELVFHNRAALTFPTLIVFFSSVCLPLVPSSTGLKAIAPEKNLIGIAHKMHILGSFDTNIDSITNCVCQCITNLVVLDNNMELPLRILTLMTPAYAQVFKNWISSIGILTASGANVTIDVCNVLKLILCCLVCIQNTGTLKSSVSSSSTPLSWISKLPGPLSTALPSVLLRCISLFASSDSLGKVSIINNEQERPSVNTINDSTDLQKGSQRGVCGLKCVQLCMNVLSICPDLIDQILKLVQSQISEGCSCERLVCALILILRKDILQPHLMHPIRKKIALSLFLRIEEMPSIISDPMLSTLKSEYVLLFGAEIKN